MTRLDVFDFSQCVHSDWWAQRLQTLKGVFSWNCWCLSVLAMFPSRIRLYSETPQPVLELSKMGVGLPVPRVLWQSLSWDIGQKCLRKKKWHLESAFSEIKFLTNWNWEVTLLELQSRSMQNNLFQGRLHARPSKVCLMRILILLMNISPEKSVMLNQLSVASDPGSASLGSSGIPPMAHKEASRCLGVECVG